ncbi:MAG TPA: hypothetical protein PLB41_05375 [Rubrivivax sp.]|nr:hypothetical protein [Rubrivivax sp.]
MVVVLRLKERLAEVPQCRAKCRRRAHEAGSRAQDIAALRVAVRRAVRPLRILQNGVVHLPPRPVATGTSA